MHPLNINIFQGGFIKSISYEQDHYTFPDWNKAVRIGRKEVAVYRVNYTDSSWCHPDAGNDP
jgi:hypothetical protein